jgi:hypothetical protein
MAVCGVYRGSVDLYQYSANIVRNRFLYFLDLETVR